MIRRDIALHSICSQFLDFFDEFLIRMILIVEPLSEKVLSSLLISPSFEKFGKYLSEVCFPDHTFSKNSREKILHHITRKSVLTDESATPHLSMNEYTVKVEEDVFIRLIHLF